MVLVVLLTQTEGSLSPAGIQAGTGRPLSLRPNRSTSSGNDAQIAGAIGLYQMERDIKEAGLGFGLIPRKGLEGGVAGCAVSAYNSNQIGRAHV